MMRAKRYARSSSYERKIIAVLETGTRGCLSLMTALIIIVVACLVSVQNVSAGQFTVTLCTDCHASPPDDGTARDNPPGAVMGSHAQHESYSISCTECHVNNAGTNHRDGNIELNDPIQGGSYSKVSPFAQTNDLDGSGLGSCSNVYCHSTGQASDGGPSGPTYATPTWGNSASGACGTCHEKDIGSVISGSHDVHLNATGVNGCGDCHTGAADDASSYSSANHVNQSIDVANTYSAGGPPGNNYGVCSAASCHDNGTGTIVDSPTWGTPVNDCSECHVKQPSSGSHARHLTTITGHGYKRPACGDCHDGAVEGSTAPAQHLDGNVDVYDSNPGDLGYPTIVAKGGSPYSSCSTAYCHSSGQAADGGPSGPTYATPTWDTEQACGNCHKAETDHVPAGQTIDSGSHTRHLQYNFPLVGSLRMKCTICHKWEAADNTCDQCHGTPGANTYHADGKIDVLMDTRFAPQTAYGDQTGVPGNGYFDCSNTYCHSDGTGGTGNTGEPRPVPANTSPAWGTTGPLACDSCHEGNATGPGYANGTPKANSHDKHTALYNCVTCHAATVDAGNNIINTAKHVNKWYDIWGALVPSYSYQADGGICTATACHGNGYPKWGTDYTGKDSCTRCHGTVSDAPAADYLKAPPEDTAGHTSAYDAQVGAHQAHLQSSLSNDVACSECHAVPSSVTEAGHINDGTPGTAELTFGVLASNNSASPDYTGGICSSVYCHGGAMPKGGTDGADRTPAWNNPDYLTGSAANDCTRCHGYPPSGIAAHSGKGPTDCITCHNYGVNAAGTGFTDVSNHINGTLDGGGDNCIDCHNIAPGNRRQVFGAGGDFGAGSNISHHIAGSSDPTSIDCVLCHMEGNTDGKMNGTYHNEQVNGGNLGYVNLRNADTGNAINTGADPTKAQYATFCLACHDSDGVTWASFPVQNIGGGDTTAMKPYSPNPAGPMVNDGFTDISGVLNVSAQWNSTVSSHRGNTGYSRAGYGAYVNGWSGGSTVSCVDCHGGWGNAASPDANFNMHGSSNVYILEIGPGSTNAEDNITNDVAFICNKCHDSKPESQGTSTYGGMDPGTGDGTGSYYKHDNNSSMSHGTFGIGCLLCHSSRGRGDIHGTDTSTYSSFVNTTDQASDCPSFSSGGKTYTCYDMRTHFLLGYGMTGIADNTTQVGKCEMNNPNGADGMYGNQCGSASGWKSW